MYLFLVLNRCGCDDVINYLGSLDSWSLSFELSECPSDQLFSPDCSQEIYFCPDGSTIPVLSQDNVEINAFQDSSVVIDPLSNDNNDILDSNNDQLVVVCIDVPTIGAITENEDGTYRYLPGTAAQEHCTTTLLALQRL